MARAIVWLRRPDVRSLSWHAVVESEAFRLAAMFALLFVTLTAGLLSAVFFIVQDAQLRALAEANQADIAALENGWREEGPAEALEVMRQLVGTPQHPGSYTPRVFIDVEVGPNAKPSGNFHPSGHPSGPATIPRAAEGHAIVGTGVRFGDDVYVFVGRDTRQVDATRARILKAFLGISCGALALGSVGGVIFGRRYLRRVRVITQTCQAIMAGRFDERVPAGGSANELDRLAATINEMLNRISHLLESLRQVSSDVAHDLRTPLARLRNRLEGISAQSSAVPHYAEAVAQALEDTDQLLGLFAAILRVSQIESGSRLAAFAHLSMTELLDRVVKLYGPVAEDHGQILQATLAPHAEVRGDGELLTQLFSNLIENAIHHTAPNTRICVELTVVGEPGARAVVATVSDDGAGIAADERDKVLRRFYRGSNSRSTAGHGLGLALVSAIANLHQAKLELLDAVPGLRVQLTFVAAAAAPSRRAPEAAQKSCEQSPS